MTLPLQTCSESKSAQAVLGRKRQSWVGLANGLAIGCVIAALGCYLSYRRDCREIRGAAQRVIAGSHEPQDRVLALLHWVHQIPRTARNENFFLLRRLRATPRQVLTGGGDCADKSRLLSAMLRQSGIPATMVMCFDPRSLAPTHTVACAFLKNKTTMVVDPAYDLYFPRREGSGYCGLPELRDDPSILLDRLRELRKESPRSHPVHAYGAERAPYGLATSINWNKNALLGLLGASLRPFLGNSLYSWPRPILLEEPKLFIAALALTAGLAAAVLPGLCRRSIRYWTHSAPAPRATTLLATAN